jgi:hypothetical protein
MVMDSVLSRKFSVQNIKHFWGTRGKGNFEFLKHRLLDEYTPELSLANIFSNQS